MLELTLRVSAIICVLVACFNPTSIAFVTNDNHYFFYSQPYATGDCYDVR